MKDHVDLGITPSGEDCVQVSKTENYMPAMRKQAERFMGLLEKAFPPQGGGYLKIKSNPHDFGSYLEVVAVYDDADEAAQEWAFGLESKVPETWAELERLAGVKHQEEKPPRKLTPEEQDALDIKEHRAVYVDRTPDCDFCKAQDLKTVPAKYDGATHMGSWANMCETHFHHHGKGLGLGVGQKLILRPKKNPGKGFGTITFGKG